MEGLEKGSEVNHSKNTTRHFENVFHKDEAQTECQNETNIKLLNKGAN